MAFKKGQSGNPGGRSKEKAFTDAVRLMLNEQDEVRGKRKLRCLAEKLYDEAMNGEGWAMCQIADRIDGKPAQDTTVTLDDKRDSADWTRDELVAFIRDAANGSGRTPETEGRSGEPDSVH